MNKNQPSRYRKRPVEVEAMLFTGSNGPEIVQWAADCDPPGEIDVSSTFDDDSEFSHNYLEIHTPEGMMTADPGSYIIRGLQGEFYPCQASIFVQSYEPMDD